MVPLRSTQEDLSAIPSAHHGECEFILHRDHTLFAKASHLQESRIGLGP